MTIKYALARCVNQRASNSIERSCDTTEALIILSADDAFITIGTFFFLELVRKALSIPCELHPITYFTFSRGKEKIKF